MLNSVKSCQTDVGIKLVHAFLEFLYYNIIILYTSPLNRDGVCMVKGRQEGALVLDDPVPNILECVGTLKNRGG